MCERWQKIILLILCLAGIVLVVVLKVAPNRIPSIHDIKKILKLKEETVNMTSLGPRDRDQIRRKNLADKVCTVTSTGGVGKILVDIPTQVSYCIIPNAGSQYWIQSFSALQDGVDVHKLISPVELSKSLSQKTLSQYLKVYHLEKGSDQAVIDETTKFIFTRNPYARLWSIYIENIFLPVMWSEIGREIVRRRKTPKQKSLDCGHDVTFLEFLDHVVLEGSKPEDMNIVWKPVQYLCSPCQLKPDFIGKVESFDVDVEYFVDKLQLKSRLGDVASQRHNLNELTAIVNSYFNILKGDSVKNCISQIGLAQRIWTSLQVNSYLPLRSEKYLESLTEKTFDINIFREHVLYVHINSEDTKHLWQKQQNKLLTGAFQEIPYRILKNLTDIYQFDFNAFGYEMFPKRFLKTFRHM